MGYDVLYGIRRIDEGDAGYMPIDETFDRRPVGFLKEFDDFRQKAFDYLYFCPSCTRSFDSETEEEKCKFCANPVKEIKHITRKKKKILNYRYFCPTCEKNFVTTEKFAVCSNCRADYIHAYTWTDLPLEDKLYIKFKKSVRNLMQQKKQKQATKRFTFPEIKFNVKRNKEELPTY